MQFDKAELDPDLYAERTRRAEFLGGERAPSPCQVTTSSSALTPLADDNRYDLQTASLQTTSGDFVAPSNDSMEAATDLLQPDPTTGTWPIPYDQFETSAGAAAYPGTMVVYAAVPTSGLSAAAASDYAAVLTFAAGPGQTPGEGVGQLPPGYLPITSANGLGGLAKYTLAAAADVAAQNGQVPPLTPVPGSSGRIGIVFFGRVVGIQSKCAWRQRPVRQRALRSRPHTWPPAPNSAAAKAGSRPGRRPQDRLYFTPDPLRHRAVGASAAGRVHPRLGPAGCARRAHHALPRPPPSSMVIDEVSTSPGEAAAPAEEDEAEEATGSSAL